MRGAAWESLTGDTVTVETAQGVLTILTSDEVISRALYENEAYQLYEVNAAISFLRSAGRLPKKGRGTVVDAGAHIGEISIGMVLAGEFERAVAIEPEPRNFALLKRNVEQNGLSEKFEIHQCALSDRDGEENLEICQGNAGDHRVRRISEEPTLGGEAARPTVRVSGRKIDTLIPDPNDVALVWMDVQGFEGHVFRGGRDFFSHDIPVNVEIWPYGIRRAGMKLDELYEIAIGFWSAFAVNPRGDGYVTCTTDRLREYVTMETRAAPIWFKDIILLK